MGERLQKLPKWARTALIVASIVAPVCGATVTAVKTYYEIRAAQKQAKDAKTKTTASYETLAPAVEEMQDIIEDALNWVDDTDDELEQLLKENKAYERRIARLELYIEILGERGRLPDIADVDIEEPSEDEGADVWSPTSAIAALRPEPPRRKEPPKAKPKRVIPKDIEQAQQYQQQRTISHCPPGDPLCGSEQIAE